MMKPVVFDVDGVSEIVEQHNSVFLVPHATQKILSRKHTPDYGVKLALMLETEKAKDKTPR